MMCDLSSSQSKHRLYHFWTTVLVFRGVAADLCCCFYIKGNLWRDCSHEIKDWEPGRWSATVVKLQLERLGRCPHVTWLLQLWVISQLKQTNKQSCFHVGWFSGRPAAPQPLSWQQGKGWAWSSQHRGRCCDQALRAQEAQTPYLCPKLPPFCSLFLSFFLRL